MDELNNKRNTCFGELLERMKDVKIPCCVYIKKGNLFNFPANHSYYDCVLTPVFKIMRVEKKSGCIELSPLIPIDIEGCPSDLSEHLFSLVETNDRFTFQLDCICGIIGLPPELVNQCLPPIEPKC
ncbi:CotY/CotZ family spore coat protein [Bacillus sp. FJAT-18017]|uniref:CotY/CotZ family spore coat protein n=1 Tax=Bacillus sp. FJAT-18017 TaxID=1705566 RepID=UPI000AE65442|nr:CotY/CotZ family spore coat protein [Bacillus sp. FJAT-18017]